MTNAEILAQVEDAADRLKSLASTLSAEIGDGQRIAADRAPRLYALQHAGGAVEVARDALQHARRAIARAPEL